LLVHTLIFALSLVVILGGSELFTNGVEWLGARLGIAEAAVGSLLAAVGTALPETLIPLIALVIGRGRSAEHSAVGIGAIIGAPLMLSTVTMLVMAIAALVFRKRRGRTALAVAGEDVRRDLAFFLPSLLAVTLIGLLDTASAIREVAAAALLITYAAYGAILLRIGRDAEDRLEQGLYLERFIAGASERPRLWAILLQLVIALAAIFLGARGFIDQLVNLSRHAGVKAGLLSLIVSPLATELPEKYNSVVWIRQSKDHLAMGNITGAMVFQSCIPVALGLLFTQWRLSRVELLACAVALGSGALLFINSGEREVGTSTLVLGGAAYVVFLVGLRVLRAF